MMIFICDLVLFMYFYRPHMRRGNVFVVSVFLSVRVSVRTVTFEAEGIETFFFSTVVDEYHI